MKDLQQTTQLLHKTYESGDYFKAELGVRDALLTWPNDTKILQLGALTALLMNQVVTAHQRLDVAMDNMPMTAQLANIQGRILKASGDWAAAEEAYNLSERLDPDFARAKINRLNLFATSEQPHRVLAELETQYDFGMMGEVARSQALTDLGRCDDALAVLQSLESEIYADQILYQRVKCFASLGQLEDMRAAFEDFPEMSALRSKALNIVVNSFEMSGDRAQSLEAIAKVSNSTFPPISVKAIKLLRRVGQDDRANSDLEDLFNQYPEDADVLNELANTARLNEKADESCEIYKRALSVRPGDFGALCGFAQAAIVAGRYAEAQTVLQGALAQSPNSQFLLALVATLLRQMGQDHTHLYDYKNFVRVYDLDTPKGYADMIAFNSALMETLNSLHVHQHEPINQSLRRGTQTELDLALIDDPTLQSFFKAVDAPIRDYMKVIGHAAGHPLQRRNRNAYRISGAWSVKLRENGHHVNHIHPMGWLSSAYYVDLPKSMNSNNQEGWIKFGEPDLNIRQPPEHFVQPKPGRLVLFPSYMWHGTVPFTGKETRLTLPFDVVPA